MKQMYMYIYMCVCACVYVYALTILTCTKSDKVQSIRNNITHYKSYFSEIFKGEKSKTE